MARDIYTKSFRRFEQACVRIARNTHKTTPHLLVMMDAWVEGVTPGRLMSRLRMEPILARAQRRKTERKAAGAS